MSDWREVARGLPLGHKRRVQHECGEGKDMVVSHGEKGYSAFCFRCGPVGFEAHGYRNLAELERVRELNALAEKETQTRDLPEDFTLSIPREHINWLLHGGISPVRARTMRIGWSPRLQRVVMPLYVGTDLRYWQARAVLRGQTPKYVNPRTDKSSLLYWVYPNGRDGDSTGRVVVTEDILSAIRVGRHCVAASILGTKTSDPQAGILSEFDRVSYWLDPDEAGRKGAQAGVRKLSLATESDSIDSDADPKNLSDREIRSLLGLPPNHRYDYYG